MSVGAAVRASFRTTRTADLQVQNNELAYQDSSRTSELVPGGGDAAYHVSREGDRAVRPNDALAAADFSQEQSKIVADTDVLADAGAETASDIAMIAIAQICYQLFECQLVLEALPYEVDLNLDEVMQEISAAQRSARGAYSAASLLRKGAALEERCETSPSRPEAIFTRHRAAVAAGAPHVVSDVSKTDRFSDGLNEYRRLDRTQDIVGPRPTCKAILRDGSRRCKKPALYLGAQSWAPNCYTHATTADRERFREHEGIEAAGRDNEERARREVLVVFGRAVMFGWADAHDEASETSPTAAAGRRTRKSSQKERRA